MKPKQNYTAGKYTPSGMDACQTPSYALYPLLPYLKADWVVWEPAAGEGNLYRELQKKVAVVIGTDLCYAENYYGHNFFDYEPEEWNALITNPPYGIKYQWLQRCYELGKPFALLLPVETLGAIKAQTLFAEYGAEFVFMNQRIDFKMPDKGWNSSAQFPVMWVTYKFGIGKETTFADIKQVKKEFKHEMGIK